MCVYVRVWDYIVFSFWDFLTYTNLWFVKNRKALKWIDFQENGECQSEQQSRVVCEFWKGVCVFSCLISLVHFVSPQYWRQVYLVTVLAMILAVFFAQIHPHYLSKQWKQLRSLIFCSVAGYGLIPTIHWICITGGFSSELVQVSALSVVTATCWLFCKSNSSFQAVICVITSLLRGLSAWCQLPSAYRDQVKES